MFKKIQKGRGRRGLFKNIQRGRGLGSVLSTIFKFFKKAAPIVAKIASSPTAKKVGKEVFKSGLRIGGETLLTNDLNSAVGSELSSVKKRVGRALLDKGSEPSPKKAKKTSKKMPKKTFAKFQSGKGKKKKNNKKSKKKIKKIKTKTKNKAKNKTKRKNNVKSKRKNNKKNNNNPFTMRDIFKGKQGGRGNQKATIFDM